MSLRLMPYSAPTAPSGSSAQLITGSSPPGLGIEQSGSEQSGASSSRLQPTAVSSGSAARPKPRARTRQVLCAMLVNF